MSQEQIVERDSPDILGSLPGELQYAILRNIREEGGIQSLFPPRAVSRKWREAVDDHLYTWFVQGPETLFCYVNLWNRFRQKLIQQRVSLRLRIRLIGYHPQRDGTQQQAINVSIQQTGAGSDDSPVVSWQPSSDSSANPSLSPRDYSVYIYDACFDGKYAREKDKIQPVDIHKRTPGRISLGSGLTKLLQRADQPPRSGTIFPLFHVIQEAWDFIMGDDAALMPIYPPIASEAWLQIRLATGPESVDYSHPPPIYIERSRDPFWPFELTGFTIIPGGTGLAGQHQFAVVSRLALPNLVEDEGILLVTVRETDVGEWIEDQRYREIMQSMIAVADAGGPQEFVLGGAVVRLEDYERFIPRGMIRWFRRRIVGRQSQGHDTPNQPLDQENRSQDSESQASSEIDSTSPHEGDNGDADDPERLLRRFNRAMERLRRDQREEFPYHHGVGFYQR